MHLRLCLVGWLQVPAMLLPMALLAWRRDQLDALWSGHFGKFDSSVDESEHLITPDVERRDAAELPV